MSKKPEPLKGIGVVSGGLDSYLAARLMCNLNVEVYLYHFLTGFSGKKESSNPACKMAEHLNLPLETEEDPVSFLEMLKHPQFGRGTSINPCVDCHIFMFKKAKEYMERINANFIFTGEVLGQRPMSQHRNALNLIERETGLLGILLRPLSAKYLNPTMMEENGWIDRTKLLDLKGRSRKPQMQLAREWGITEYPTPAGGCLLTDKEFGQRLKDLLDSGDESKNSIELLKYGRHFRLSPTTKVIIGRNESENTAIENLVFPGELLLTLADIPGPTGLISGNTHIDLIKLAGSIVKRYSHAAGLSSASVIVKTSDGEEKYRIDIEGRISEEKLFELRVGL
jgi:tRNA U34 2-thiouridine synthase MnmA/TrmU